MQGPVGVAVTATMQPMAMGLARTGGDGRGPAQVGEGGLSTQPLGALAGSGQQLPSMVDPDRVQLQQPGGGPADQLGEALVGEAELLVELVDAAGDRPKRRLDALDRIGQGGLVRSQPSAGDDQRGHRQLVQVLPQRGRGGD